MARRDEGTVVIVNYKEFLLKLKETDKKFQREARNELRAAGDLVRAEGQERFRPYNERSAAGYRVIVRQRGVAVEQSLRKTTGDHPEWGTKQMVVALIPALKGNTDKIVANFNRAFDSIARRF